MPEPGHVVDNARFDSELACHVPNLAPTDFTYPERSRADGLAAFRARGLHVPEESELHIEDRLVPGLCAQAPPVKIRIYRPHGPGPLPAVLWLHGGCFVRGAVEIDHPEAARAAAELRAVVVSVDYRLAPEHPYPAAIDDCQAALQWLVCEVEDVASDRVAVVGISAGGGLAAALAMRVRDRGAPALCLQALVIPMLDDRLDTPSMREFTDLRIFSRGVAEAGWQHYLGGAGISGEPPPDAAPGRSPDLTDLPPAYLCTAELDPLRDEGIDYAVRLTRAGVPVELHQFPGTFHGSQFVVRDAAISRRMCDELYASLARSFSRRAPLL